MPTSSAISLLTELQQQLQTDFKLLKEVTAQEEELLNEYYIERIISATVSQDDPRQIAGLRKQLREESKRAREQRTSLNRLTPYEDASLISILHRIYDDLTGQVRQTNLYNRFPEKVVLATLPVGQCDALTIPVYETGEFIIGFHRGLFGTLNLMGSLAIDVLLRDKPSQITWALEPGAITQELQRRPEVIEQFSTALRALLVMANPHSALPVSLPYPLVQRRVALVEAAERFVLAHELGHIVMDHFHEPDTEATVGTARFLTSWQTNQQEFAADLRGLEFVVLPHLKDLEDNNPSTIFWNYTGAQFFLICIEVITKVLAVLRTGSEHFVHTSSHPSAHIRKQGLREALSTWIGAHNAEGASFASEAMCRLFQELFDSTRDDWTQMHARGVEISNVWCNIQFSDAPAKSPELDEELSDLDAHGAMEEMKGSYFLSLLRLNVQDECLRREAADYIERYAGEILLGLAHELAHGPEPRRTETFQYLLDQVPELTQIVGQLKYVIVRYPNVKNIIRVPELIMVIDTLKELLIRYIIPEARKGPLGKS